VKAKLKEELVAFLQNALATAEAAHANAIEGTTHSESKSEGDKDTRATEASYVARGQAMRIEELRTGLIAVEKMSIDAHEKIASGSLVTVGEKKYFVAPAGGGTMLSGKVQVVTPKSPLGRALCGKEEDDEVEVNARTLTITRIE